MMTVNYTAAKKNLIMYTVLGTYVMKHFKYMDTHNGEMLCILRSCVFTVTVIIRTMTTEMPNAVKSEVFDFIVSSDSRPLLMTFGGVWQFTIPFISSLNLI